MVTESINNHLKLKYKGTKKTALLLEQSLFFMAGFIYLSHEGNFFKPG
jgi:hypothetical protein